MIRPSTFVFVRFCLDVTAPYETYTLSLHDALPISNELKLKLAKIVLVDRKESEIAQEYESLCPVYQSPEDDWTEHRCEHFGKKRDRKSTRLNSSHVKISYAVFCLKKNRAQYIETTF